MSDLQSRVEENRERMEDLHKKSDEKMENFHKNTEQRLENLSEMMRNLSRDREQEQPTTGNCVNLEGNSLDSGSNSAQRAAGFQVPTPDRGVPGSLTPNLRNPGNSGGNFGGNPNFRVNLGANLGAQSSAFEVEDSVHEVDDDQTTEQLNTERVDSKALGSSIEEDPEQLKVIFYPHMAFESGPREVSKVVDISTASSEAKAEYQVFEEMPRRKTGLSKSWNVINEQWVANMDSIEFWRFSYAHKVLDKMPKNDVALIEYTFHYSLRSIHSPSGFVLGMELLHLWVFLHVLGVNSSS